MMTNLPVFYTPAEAVKWMRSLGVAHLTVDSRQADAGAAFIAWPGAATDGRRFVPDALAQGAAACLVERHDSEAWLAQWHEQWGDQPDAANWMQRVAVYEGLKAATGQVASLWFDSPSADLDVLAVTGTNGKTSTAWWLAQAVSAVNSERGDGESEPGRSCGFVGTLGVGYPPDVDYTGLTTPDPVTLHAAFRRFADQGARACTIEASSIGLAERRLDGTSIRTALFTNFTQDHLDYHGSMAAYWNAKAELFERPELQSAVVNVNDARGRELALHLAKQRADVALWTYGVNADARLSASNVVYENDGLAFDVTEQGAASVQTCHAATRLIGDYNVANVMAVIGALRAQGVPLEQAVRACAVLQPVPGRMACLANAGQPLVVVDFAHTPDAVEKVLQALRPMAWQRDGQLWIALGCGGDRDPVKRPLMAAVAEQLADKVVITSDNPRSEQPGAIIDQMLAGLKNPSAALVQPDRAAAIAEVIAQAQATDVVLLAGKGHEQYQEIAGVRHPFSDIEVARVALNKFGKRAESSMSSLNLTLQQIKAWLDAAGEPARLVGDANTVAQRVHTDTRTLAAGDLFLALRGENFDAHDFLMQAAASGAVAVVAEHGVEASGLPGIEVGDTRRALGFIGTAWRAQFDIPLIAVAGSNGKTTVTQMLASVLQAWHGDDALFTQGNFNNDIGVPLTLLRLRAHHRSAVVELGMNHPGEIAWLAPLASPTVALVNNAQREHQEFMATVEASARENGTVFLSLRDGGTAVFPADGADAPFVPLWRELAGKHTVRTFGESSQADAWAEAEWAGDHWKVNAQSAQGTLTFDLHLAGRHNVRNALAVMSCARAAGVPDDMIARGISAFRPVKGRSHARVIDVQGRAVALIDDSYNANPDSVRAAIDVLADLPAPRLLVLGDMGEVGDQGPEFHAEVGLYAAERGIGFIWTLGDLTRHTFEAARDSGKAEKPRHFDSMEALQVAVLEVLPQMSAVLVKGSRFMCMERVVQVMLDSCQPSQPQASATLHQTGGAAASASLRTPLKQQRKNTISCC